MKPRLLILSDMFGFDNSAWIENYKGLLKSDFQLTFYDSLELAGIDKTNLSKEDIHSQFINGGIQNAINKLLQIEKEEVSVLAFSIGGTIAWKAALKGLNIKSVIAISSTRLRNEIRKPNCRVHVIYGEDDPYKPEELWYKELNLKVELIKNEQHEMYKKIDFTQDLCKRIINIKSIST